MARGEESGAASSTSAEASRRQIRGSTLLLAGRGIGVALNFAVQVLMVRYLSKAEYGAFAYAMALMLMGAHVVDLGLERGVSRFVPVYQERRDYGAMAGTIVLALGAILGCGALAIALVLALQGVVGPRVAPDPLALSLSLVLICAAPLQALDDVAVKLFAILASPRALFLRRHVLTPGLRLAAVLALIAFRGDAFFLALVWVVAGLVGFVVSALFLAGVLRDQGLLAYFWPGRLRIPAKRVLRFSLPLLSTYGLAAARGHLVVFLLGAFHAATSVASFRAVYPVAHLNLLVFDTFKLLFSPTASRLYARGDREGIDHLYWRTTSWIVVLSFPIFAASFSLAGPLAVALFGPQYADSAGVLTVLAFGYFVNATCGFNALTLQVFRKVRAIVAIDVGALAFSLVSSLLLIPRLGALGGAIASCATLVLQNALYQAVLVRGGAVRALDRGFLRVVSAVLAAALLLLAVQSACSPPLAVGLGLAAAAGLLVLAVALPVLEVEETFPELGRYALLRRLALSTSRAGRRPHRRLLRPGSRASR
jgi:O-antigen/teichoic acid export membrane protein